MLRYFVLIVLILISGASFFVFSKEDLSVISPLPMVFGVASEKQLEIWRPDDSKTHSDSEISVSAGAGILADYETGEIVFSKNIHERLPAASTIKIMTALVALEHSNISDKFTVSQNAATVGENSMGLSKGEELTLEELLYGLILVSGNDSAVAISEGVAGNEENFVQLMNRKAKELELENTKFINSSGLDDDRKNQYSSAYDMAVISRYVWENFPEFREVSSTFHKYIETNELHKAYDLYNDTNLLLTYPGVKGIKPGFTWEAGLCLVTYAENEDKKLIGVVLGSEDRRGEMIELLDFGFESFGITVSHPELDL